MASSVRGQAEKLLLSEALPILQEHGQAVQQFLTATLHSSPLRSPTDLIFVPDSGPQQGVEFVIELKCSRNARLDNAWLDFALSASRRIHAANWNLTLKFILATTASLSEKQWTWVREQKLEVFDRITDGRDLASRLIKMAGLKSA